MAAESESGGLPTPGPDELPTMEYVHVVGELLLDQAKRVLTLVKEPDEIRAAYVDAVTDRDIFKKTYAHVAEINGMCNNKFDLTPLKMVLDEMDKNVSELEALAKSNKIELPSKISTSDREKSEAFFRRSLYG
jgi:hypothetical protein